MKRPGIILVACMFPCMLQATHIIGGEIYYDCLGSGNYRITMKAYRDCYNGVPFFDDPALINVFSAAGTLVQTVYAYLDLNNVRVLDPWIDNPCLTIPPDVCVEEAFYEEVVYLPPIPGGYRISYQRCCRNQTISNIVDPGGTGTTYYITMDDTVQAQCSSSPRFRNYPPVFICRDEALVFDHSATDPDGDSLVYELCTPYTGGSRSDPIGNNPVIPPPYSFITWQAPYGQNDPLGGIPLTVDPATGLLTGTPNTLGQFVVGVCVKEYRNGRLLTVNKRDFQFNVMYCAPIATASVPPTVNQCGDSVVTFTNNSTGAFTYFWDFGVPGTAADTSAAQFPVYTYPGPGQYVVTLIINKGMTCADTAYSNVYIYPAVVADFIATNQCLSFATAFTDLSRLLGPGNVLSWQWSFGDGTTSVQQDPVHTYSAAGSYNVGLTVTSEHGCTAAVTKTVQVFPVPYPDFSVVSGDGCVPFTVAFSPDSIRDTAGIYIWDFGDGSRDTTMTPFHIYSGPGVFTVSLRVITSQGCTDSLTRTGLVTVLPRPTAGFTPDPWETDIMQPFFTFTDHSFNAAEWRWSLGDGATDTARHTAHEYADTGLYHVVLVVTDARGCTDTIAHDIYIRPIPSFYLPNAFTPNGDGRNDVFMPVSRYIGNFRMLIFDRWGNFIFETTDVNNGWNGKVRKKAAPEDVYVYKLFYRDVKGREREWTGKVSLVR